MACGGSAVDGGTPSGAPSGAAAGSANGASSNGGTTSTGDSVGAPSVDIQACSDNADCEVAAQDCCNCGSESLGAYRAINQRFLADDAARCNNVNCNCGLSIPAGPDLATQYFVPTCRAGRCQVVDLRATAIVGCQTAADCTLRSGAACCQGCGANAIAVNVNGEAPLEELVCGSEPTACGKCAPVFTDLGVDCTAIDRPGTDQQLLPAPRCVVVDTSCFGLGECFL